MGDQEQRFWKRRFSTVPGIRAVGRRDCTAAQNRSHYIRAARVFTQLVNDDLEPEDRNSALEFGYGLGHYTKLCRQLGFRRYVGLDFASPARLALGSTYDFRQQDVGVPFDLGERFDLVFAIDVIYHVLPDAEFDQALDNLRLHARKHVYLTGLFEELDIRHCHHRPMERFERLGRLVDVRPWRDNKIARFAVDQ